MIYYEYHDSYLQNHDVLCGNLVLFLTVIIIIHNASSVPDSVGGVIELPFYLFIPFYNSNLAETMTKIEYKQPTCLD